MNQKMIEEILEYLPHRYPMLLVDRITDVVTDESIRGFKNITYNEQVFQGHFPQRPILPGVMILEALAQISGILALQGRDLAKDNPGIYLFAGIYKARFRRPVVPGDRLDLVATYKARKSNFAKFDCEASVDGQLACSASLTVVEQKT